MSISDGRDAESWDLPEGEAAPSNEKTAFLKNLTRHMLGDSHDSDTSLLDNVLTDAIGRVYKRCAIRYSNPIPTFNDLREELGQTGVTPRRCSARSMKRTWRRSTAVVDRRRHLRQAV